MYTKEVFNNKMNSWINIDAENTDELKNLYRDYGIDREFVDYSLDRNERAHLDYDKATDVLLLIFNAPNRRKIDNHYETVPMTFIVVNRTLITVTNQQTKYLYFEIKNYLEKIPRARCLSCYLAVSSLSRSSISHLSKEWIAIANVLVIC